MTLTTPSSSHRRVLIVGCGYLGERAARRWLTDGAEVWTVTRSPQRAEEWRRQGFHPVVADLLKPVQWPDLPEFDMMLYAVGFDRTSGATKREVYVNGLEPLLAVLSPRVRRWVYVSSTSVYGQSAGEWVDESSPCEPQEENGRICLDAEKVALASNGILLRFSGLYGPGRLLSRVESLRAGTPLTGNPDAWLNLIYIDDAVTAVRACANHGQAGEIYLGTDNQPIRRRDYYSQLAKCVGAPLPVFPTSVEQPAQINKRCSNRRLAEELGVTLEFPTIETGLPRAVMPAIENPPTHS